jgi:small subunit ribosomal protein S15
MAKVTKKAKKTSVKKTVKKAAPAKAAHAKAKPQAQKAKTKPAANVPAPSQEKQKIIKEFQVKDGDTGSPEVQIALLSSRIDKLVGHLKANPSDNHSRRGLLGIVSKRRRLMNYLEKLEVARYKEVLGKLGLSK